MDALAASAIEPKQGRGIQGSLTMHLTSVHMENFKSFGRKLTVPFEPGFTGITGPNGSGKSNIGDAILFVLGPNSPRAIRAGRLTDLIFNGGEKGKAASYTLVSLTFDNQDRTMPIDEDDVVLTRKVKKLPKKGDPDNYSSRFYVNGRPSQKREFVNLLQHARIAADGYNITQQGDVLQICQMTPVQRRGILDNISGVTTYDTDIQRAAKQQVGVEEDLERIAIVMEEIDRNLKQLEREKGAAQKYRDLKESIVLTKAQMAFRRRRDLQSEIKQVHDRMAKMESEREGHRTKYEELAGQTKTAEAELKALEQQIREEGGEEVQKIQDDLTKARDKMTRLEERIHFAKDSLSSGDDEVLPFMEQLRKAEKELANTTKITAECTATYDAKSKELVDARKELESTQDLISKSDDGAMAVQRELSKLKKAHEDAETALHKARLDVDRINERREAAHRALEAARSEAGTIATDLEEVTWELEELQKTSSGSGKRKKELERRLFELQKSQAENTKQADDLEGRMRRLSRDLAELQAAQEAAAKQSGNVPPAVQHVIKAREDGVIKGIIGTIRELATADPEFETALGIAAGSNMHAVVVEDDAIAAECIEMLNRTKAGRAKFLPLNKMAPGRPRGQALMKVKKEGCLGFALDVIDFNERYHGAFWQVFGDTLVVKDMDAGRRLMGGVRMVTLGGELFEAAGAMVGGKDRQKAKGSGFSNADRGRLDKVMDDLRKAEDGHEQALQAVARIREELQSLETELSKYGRESGSSADRIKDLEKRKVQLTERHRVVAADVTKQEGLLAGCDTDADAHAANIKELEAGLVTMEQQREEKSKLMLKGSKKEWREKVEGLDAAIRSLHEEVLKAENRKDVAGKQADLVQQRIKELKDQIDAVGGDHSKHQADLERFTKEHKQAKADVDALMKMEREATKSLRGLSDKRDAAYKRLTDLKAQMDKQQDRMDTHHSLIVNQKAKLPALQEQLEEAEADLREHPLSEEDGKDLPHFEELRKKLRNMEQALDRLGAVNMRALEEFEEQSSRRADLVTEVERLQKQLDELVALVAEISTKKKDKFMEVFDAVNTNFADVYKDISMGGKAYMELEDPKDPFAGGLILKAQPLGKRVTRLDALSGGEKSLTSMAFIFALQRHDPSPFYYFDEVDQNLDAVNSELLARMIKQNAKFAQFIVVSLRKITLKEASFLYGVTQQVPGQSEIIANFDLEHLQEEEPDEGGNGTSKGTTVNDAATVDGADGTLTVQQTEQGLQESIEGMMQVKADR